MWTCQAVEKNAILVRRKNHIQTSTRTRVARTASILSARNVDYLTISPFGKVWGYLDRGDLEKQKSEEEAISRRTRSIVEPRKENRRPKELI